MKRLLLLLFFITPTTFASDVLDQKIEKFCKIHPLANELNFWIENYKRCILIWQAQFRFEAYSCTKIVWNNCFNFQSIWIKKSWNNDFWVYWIKKRFLLFKDKTNSIKFYVNRYYLYDTKKTIRQVVEDFTMTKSHRDWYIKFIKNYYSKNLKYLAKK